MNKALIFPLLALALSTPAIAKPAPAKTYAAALASPNRPASDKERDAARKPADLLAFARIKRGQKVADFVMGGGYATRVLSAAVGPRGLVYAYQPAEFVAFRAQYGTDQDEVAAANRNVKPVRTPAADFALPEKVDTIITVQNFHDLYLPQGMSGAADKAIAGLKAALKPGGTLVIVDHVAAAGSDVAATAGTLHRIDPAFVRSTLEKAGFRFDGESTVWRNAADAGTENVFSPAIRGKTDQFAYRFRKVK